MFLRICMSRILHFYLEKMEFCDLAFFRTVSFSKQIVLRTFRFLKNFVLRAFLFLHFQRGAFLDFHPPPGARVGDLCRFPKSVESTVHHWGGCKILWPALILKWPDRKAGLLGGGRRVAWSSAWLVSGRAWCLTLCLCGHMNLMCGLPGKKAVFQYSVLLIAGRPGCKQKHFSSMTESRDQGSKHMILFQLVVNIFTIPSPRDSMRSGRKNGFHSHPI